MLHFGNCHHVQGAIQSAISAAVEPVSDGISYDAGIGLTPANEANSASVVTRPWWDHAAKHLAALIA